MSTPLAASLLSKVGDLIDKFGAYAGFAAVLGLALLTLLYIAQARELKRLREWAGQMPERVGDLQGRLGGPPAPASPVAPVVPAQPVVRPEPVQPPAAATATQAIATPAAAAAAAAAAAKAPADAAAKPAEGPSLTPGKTGADGARVAAGQPTQALPATAPVNPLDRARQPQTARAAGVPATGAPRPRGPVIAASIAALAALGAVGYLLFGNSDGGGGAKVTTTATQTAATKTTQRPRQPTGAQLNGQTKIFVLNGTTTTGLAQRVESALTKKGFKALGRDTATDQTRVATAVMFAPGKRADAVRVANALGKGAEIVQPVDPGSAAQAKRPDGTVPDVVVLVGSDENTAG